MYGSLYFPVSSAKRETIHKRQAVKYAAAYQSKYNRRRVEPFATRGRVGKLRQWVDLKSSRSIHMSKRHARSRHGTYCAS